ncbi:MAG TPA: acyl-CoA dehydrogenase family protein, partial [Thermoleophilaceae bacterium]|nr:acyl-CoA dehydrogenase family protein [Thermoleophilaceae bacterium]
MDLTFTDDQLAFRDELRDWLAANPPGDEPADEDSSYRWRTEWQRRLNDGGWAGVHWPKEYGGRGASLMETAIFFEELGRAGAPLPSNVLGLLLAGPTLMVWGTDAQKERYLPTI